MPDPGSHHYDVKRTRLRAEFDDHGVPDQHADQAANEELQQDHPPRPLGDPERAAGPTGTRGSSRGDPGIDEPARALAGQVELRSPAFSDHTLIPERHSYQGENISPALEWSGIPDGTAELALVCEDPDAPGGTFTHWLVTNITAETTGVPEGDGPSGSTAWPNDFGDNGWGGPRPPVGDDPHRYFFRLHALDEPVDAGAAPEQVRAHLEEHTLARGTLVGLFGR